jgi:predicted MFS family arabinose efflux permease
VLQALVLLPLLVVHGRSQLPIVYTVILFQAALAALFDPAKSALLPTLLPADELVSANALVGLSQSLGRLVGGPLAGLLLVAGDLRLIAAADLITYVLAAALVSRLQPRIPVRSASPGSSHRSPTPAGFISTFRGRRVRATLLVTFTAQIAQGIFVVLFVLFVALRLHGGSAEIGLLRGVQAMGAIAAGVTFSVVARTSSPTKLTAWASITFGVVDLVVWNLPFISTATAIYVGLFILIGAPGILLGTGLVSSLQLAGAKQQHGTVFSAFGLVGNAGQALGMLAAGLLTAPLGLMTMLNAQAGLYLAAGALAAGWMRDGVTHRFHRATPASASTVR